MSTYEGQQKDRQECVTVYVSSLNYYPVTREQLLEMPIL